MDSVVSWEESCVKCGALRPLSWVVELMDGELICRTCLWGEPFGDKVTKQQQTERRRQAEYQRRHRRKKGNKCSQLNTF